MPKLRPYTYNTGIISEMLRAFTNETKTTTNSSFFMRQDSMTERKKNWKSWETKLYMSGVHTCIPERKLKNPEFLRGFYVLKKSLPISPASALLGSDTLHFFSLSLTSIKELIQNPFCRLSSAKPKGQTGG